MKHHARLLLVVCVAACTYNEYKNYYEVPITTDRDAGPSEDVGAGGSEAGQGGNGGSATAAAGEGGSALTGSSGAQGASAGACTGCVRINVVSGRSAEYQLELETRRNLSDSLVLWRVRVRDYVDQVQLVAYVESGDHVPNGFARESATTVATLSVDSGWQDIGIDLALLAAFRDPSFDAGGDAGERFDPGNPFDKSRVERVGLRVAPFSQFGVFTPATVELDAVTFSSSPALNVDFSANQAGFELVNPDTATIGHVPQ